MIKNLRSAASVPGTHDEEDICFRCELQYQLAAAGLQVANVSSLYRFSQPATITLTVRSSSDPWLKYMAVTNDQGDFGPSKVRGSCTWLAG